jgi:hypothetical protein
VKIESVIIITAGRLIQSLKEAFKGLKLIEFTMVSLETHQLLIEIESELQV